MKDNTEQQQTIITADELGQEWYGMLSQYMQMYLTFKKENELLKAKLHQAEIDLIKARKNITEKE